MRWRNARDKIERNAPSNFFRYRSERAPSTTDELRLYDEVTNDDVKATAGAAATAAVRDLLGGASIGFPGSFRRPATRNLPARRGACEL